METILTNIQQELTKVPALKYIDENWGQLTFYGSNIPVQWPCCLIGMQSAQFSDIGMDRSAKPVNRQEGNLTFEITIAKQKLTNTSLKAPNLQKIQAFEIWEIVEKVHETLQGFKPLPNCGKMVRTGFNSVRRDDGVQEIRVIYTAGIHDC
ncbi:hypothetical protein [Chryseobacterium koreense]|uniref:Uncharacterized protein n=1 Tax=Chryseobacterium koreense CCUG 49689 TaxID=1304281 RepID=A0A0J7LMB0_9FLAO|nr:hypothetical protein [Chryseobacterium koreense]KMQ70230.1 hypothetical protein ACM44_13310 [Chryseobacterium koreense CCUG 49689]MBB5334725.1 hypothetical protein [Chryseobacterium koreense]